MLVCFGTGTMVAVFRQAGTVACAREDVSENFSELMGTVFEGPAWDPIRACGLSDIHSFLHLCYLMGLQGKRVVSSSWLV